MAQQSNWLFRIIDSSGNQINLIRAKKRKVSLGLNKAGECSFELDLSDDKATDTNLKTGVSTVEVLRGGKTFFKGQLMVREKRLDQINRIVNCKTLGWLWLLSKRFAGVASDREFSNTDAGAIAWALINESQQQNYGDFLITQGAIETSQNITITYIRANIKEAIEDLSAIAGIEFEITDEKVFNVFYPFKGTDRTSSVIFKYPGAIKSIREIHDSTTIINNEIVLGQGWGDQELSANSEDVNSENTYKRREAIVSRKEINNAVSLSNIAEYDVGRLRNPSTIYDIALHGNNEIPNLDNYNVGDIVKVQVDDEQWSFEQVFRIFEIHVNIDENDKENISLIMGAV